jgi:hypothetical protein
MNGGGANLHMVRVVVITATSNSQKKQDLFHWIIPDKLGRKAT